jgi:hypothetical protein
VAVFNEPPSALRGESDDVVVKIVSLAPIDVSKSIANDLNPISSMSKGLNTTNINTWIPHIPSPPPGEVAQTVVLGESKRACLQQPRAMWTR